ncbi:hypothetical protein [Paenibacillus popilliae]|uniref:Uncharacterized protein n=1 Tax=Paenibacillus popilliae TaxID=78057 RepID=A0ABY3ALJ9_PAEPP|nr:hypothetical protein [Paenibacillus sp. SDF0028]TQR43361.1 hypothetical protein C7Y44_19555 [Paenibacillus sp. SDF0028]
MKSQSRKQLILSLLASTALIFSLQPAITYANNSPASVDATNTSSAITPKGIDKIYVSKEEKYSTNTWTPSSIPKQLWYYDGQYAGYINAESSYTISGGYYIFTYSGYVTAININ